MTFEQGLHRISEITKQLQATETSVEAGIALYKEAADILVQCHTILSEAKLQIDEITVNLDE